MPSIFPGGNAGMQNLTLTTNWHVIAHNRYALRLVAVAGTALCGAAHHAGVCTDARCRYWSDNTNYAKQNGGEWDFVVEPQNQLSIPVEEAFWE